MLIMQKILVTTDFSAHSKAGIRFAIQLSTQMEVELIFFHCFSALIPTTIHRERIEEAIRKETDVHLKKLEKFVESIYRSMEVTPGIHGFSVAEGFDPERAILDYARENDFQYICISTRGAGSLKKIIGTNTSNIIVKSAVPVLAIPHTYRLRPIKKILYASDLENLEVEMKQVSALADALEVKTDLAHFYYPGQISLDRDTLAAMWRKKHKSLDQVYFSQFNLDKSFAKQLDLLMHKAKPSLAVFFTHTKKTWFDKLFGSSVSESFSYVAKTPILVFRKKV
jgi:nucleotide-binding universal stress UspA family protein